MKLRVAAAVTTMLITAASFAQSASPAPNPAFSTSAPGGARARMPLNPAGKRAMAAEDPSASLRQRVQDMEGTLTKMHEVLAQMRRKSPAPAKDSMAKANLDMWELMVTHLDGELRELKTALLVREDMEARRAAMYKQADAKAQAEATRAAQTMVKQTQDGSSAAQPASSPDTHSAAPADATSPK